MRRNNYYHHCAPPLLKSFRRLAYGTKPSAARLLLWACLARHRQLLHSAQQCSVPRANAGSSTLSAYVGSYRTQTWLPVCLPVLFSGLFILYKKDVAYFVLILLSALMRLRSVIYVARSPRYLTDCFSVRSIHQSQNLRWHSHCKVEHSNSGKKSSIRFVNLINLPLLHWYSNSNDGECGEGPGRVSLRCGSFCAISVSIRQFPTS